MPDTFRLEVNRVQVSVEADGDVPLLYILRNELGLKGTRFGCGQGLCGSCTVLLDGNAVHSCDTSLGEAAGRAITTVEGLLDASGRPGRVQQALMNLRAGQCGYCLSGIVMRIEAGLRAGADRSAIVDKLDGNLCRCGAHARILRALDTLLQEAG